MRSKSSADHSVSGSKSPGSFGGVCRKKCARKSASSSCLRLRGRGAFGAEKCCHSPILERRYLTSGSADNSLEFG